MKRKSRNFARYGMLELKRSYRKNLSIGIFLACLFSFSAVGGAMILSDSGMEETEYSERPIVLVNPDTLDIEYPPPPLPPERGEAVDIPKPEDLNIGPPVGVEDEGIIDEEEFVTNDQLKFIDSYEPTTSLESLEGKDIRFVNEEDALPLPDKFVAYEEGPEIIQRSMPAYPEMARRAGVTGDVWVNVLVDQNGKVRDVKIVNCSNRGLGFEKSAMESAYQSMWKPAISNNQPVAVWITYKISFKLA